MQTQLALQSVAALDAVPRQQSSPESKLVGGVDITPVPSPSPSQAPQAEETGEGLLPAPVQGELAVASLVVLSLPDLHPVNQDDLQVGLTVPYVPGFLGFR